MGRLHTEWVRRENPLRINLLLDLLQSLVRRLLMVILPHLLRIPLPIRAPKQPFILLTKIRLLTRIILGLLFIRIVLMAILKCIPSIGDREIPLTVRRAVTNVLSYHGMLAPHDLQLG